MMVGFQIKNNLTRNPACAQNPNVQQVVCVQAIMDAEVQIRKIASSIISLAARENVWAVEQLVPSLSAQLQTHASSAPAVHGIMRALSEIVDDCIQLLDMRHITDQIVGVAFSYLTTDLGQSKEALEVRLRALHIMRDVLEQAGIDNEGYSYRFMRTGVLQVIDACFANLQAPLSTEIASAGVECLVLSLTFYDLIDDQLFGRMLALMVQVTNSSQDMSGSEEQLRIAATGFWSAVLYFPHFQELAEETMKQVIPTLVRAMMFSDMEIGMLQANASDWNVPDKEEDIRPRHYQAKEQTVNDDDDGDGLDEEVEDYNLRRISASTLDSISAAYGDRILPPVLTAIDAMMQTNRPWRELEAAVLAVGAISEGCFDSLRPYLPSVVGRLLQLLEDPETHFLVVAISLWTVSQLGNYVVEDAALLERFIVHSALAKMQNPSKFVQDYATTALLTMVKICVDAYTPITPFIHPIAVTIGQCLQGYQLKNRVLLLETLKTVCESAGEDFRQNEAATQAFLGPLGQLWMETSNDSMLLFSLFDCMSGVAAALGTAMEPMAENIFSRGFGMLQHHLQLRRAAEQANQDPPEVEFLITSADLLSGLFCALGGRVEALIQSAGPTFMQVVLALLTDELSDIRSSGFSLTGDVAGAVPAYLQAVLPAFCDAALLNLNELSEANSGVISNLAWTLCNLIENAVSGPQLHLLNTIAQGPQLFQRLALLLGTSTITADMRNMAENITLYIGLALNEAPDLPQRTQCPLATFSKRFLEYARDMKYVPQKDTAVAGFLLALQQPQLQLQLVGENLILFFDLACSLAQGSPDVQRVLKELLLQVKRTAPQQWQTRLASYSEQHRIQLFQVYGLN
ncbi:transportin 1 [Strigomonas culicis]|nr:transportin 1 [Strigomonas culicis]|eukprot:EPY23241.1 transportin 1 [Strigomonas culicis]